MANELILLTTGNAENAERIVAAFARETGLVAEPREEGVSFALGAGDHQIKIVETLNEIDPDWSSDLTLGQPDAATP